MARRTSPRSAPITSAACSAPRTLMQAREDVAAGRISPDELRAVEDDAIRDAIAMQEDIGLRSATDGEFRRASWHMDFIYAARRRAKAPSRHDVQFRNEAGDIEFTPAAIRVTGKLGIDETIFGDAFEFLRDTSPRRCRS